MYGTRPISTIDAKQNQTGTAKAQPNKIALKIPIENETSKIRTF